MTEAKTFALMAAAFVFLLPSAAAWAQSASDLERLEKQLESSQQQTEELRRRADQLAHEISGVQDDLVRAAKAVQDTEEQTMAIETRLAALSKGEQAKAASLAGQRQQMTTTLLALERLTRQPRAAMLLVPAPAAETARTARLLGLAVPALDARARKLQNELASLRDTRAAMAEQSSQLRAALEKLDRQNEALQALLTQKASLQKSTLAESAAAQARTERLAEQAKNLQALMDRLAAEAAKRQKAADAAAAKAAAAKAAAQKQQAQNSATPQTASKPADTASEKKPGSDDGRRFPEDGKGLIPPARGKIAAGFGEAKGIVVETRPDAKVVSPFDGDVAFVGPFRGYGSIVIIEHKGGYHTVLAGLAQIDTAQGQHLRAGEPVGAMGGRNTQPAAAGAAADAASPGSLNGGGAADGPRLYIELRHNGQPVDPLPLLGGKIARDETPPDSAQ